MPQVTIALPAAYTHPTNNERIRWEDADAGLGNLVALLPDGGTAAAAHLIRFQLSTDNDVVQVRTSESLPGALSAAGPDLSAVWEGHESAVVVSVAALGDDLVLSGPTFGGGGDPTEPYSWSPTDSYDSGRGMAGWLVDFLALDAAQQLVTLRVSDGVSPVHDATLGPIVAGVPTLTAASEVSGTIHDAVLDPIVAGVPALTAASQVAGVVHDAALDPIVSGAPVLTADSDVIDVKAFQGILAVDGDRVLSGAAAAAQRLADALRIQRGSYPLLRDYGSTVGQVLDRRPAAIFAAVAETLVNPANGLDDITLRGVRVAPGAVNTGSVVVDVDAEWLSDPAATPTPISVREQLAAP